MSYLPRIELKESIVSIIIAAYNAEKFIQDSVESALSQSYRNIEVIVVDDGSSDQTLLNLKSIEDKRLQVHRKNNGGVSSARNVALNIAKGDFFCFLDADDILPADSIRSRVDLMMKNSGIDFVDGKVEYVSNMLMPLDRTYIPNFHGNPMPLLLRLDRSCLFGNTWMIRKREGIKYEFNESLTHAEDLYFYLSICNQYEAKYSFVNTTILKYRQHPHSAMKNLKGLENGYYKLLQTIQSNISHTRGQFHHLKLRVIRIMFLSHLIDGKDLSSAFRVVFKFSWI